MDMIGVIAALQAWHPELRFRLMSNGRKGSWRLVVRTPLWKRLLTFGYYKVHVRHRTVLEIADIAGQSRETATGLSIPNGVDWSPLDIVVL